jgi:hypothetical protein
MRLLILIVPLIFAGCEAEAPQAEPALVSTLKVGHYFQVDGRGRLCVRPADETQRAIFIAYGKGGGANCSASGVLKANGKRPVLVPAGEGGCRIPIIPQGDRVMLGRSPAACDYYCGSGLKLGGQSFQWADTSTADVVADPLLPDDAAC